jgi:putative endonuclease
MGAAAEQLVSDWLTAQGLTVVARNLRLGPLELDIVARDGPLVLIVEVRCRRQGARVSGLTSVVHCKRERLRRAARRLWRDRYANDSSAERLRFDVASVTFGPDGAEVEYIAAAF